MIQIMIQNMTSQGKHWIESNDSVRDINLNQSVRQRIFRKWIMSTCFYPFTNLLKKICMKWMIENERVKYKNYLKHQSKQN